ncbi:hypothetical protein [Methanosarcina siciliae]|uniref:hypothetical protein n=1 Tax=Methanosarcina siciliae TaxID=38027 RepID=UPI000A5C4B92|nr:hypothetical protein [Methanosarcina siciliae]
MTIENIEKQVKYILFGLREMQKDLNREKVMMVGLGKPGEPEEKMGIITHNIQKRIRR